LTLGLAQLPLRIFKIGSSGSSRRSIAGLAADAGAPGDGGRDKYSFTWGCENAENPNGDPAGTSRHVQPRFLFALSLS
jgi:hypothetical protein